MTHVICAALPRAGSGGSEGDLMQAIVQDRYGAPDVLRLAEVDKPAAGDGEVLVRVRAASVHADVWHVVAGLPYVLRLMGAGLRKPKNPIPGTDMAGVVEAVGANVTHFRPGDEVFGETRRGMQWANGGAYAEYVAAPADILARKPPNITFAQAASVPTSGAIALHNLQSAGLPQPGQKVLVNGAGGGVGTIAVQLAKAYGAEVTAVDSAEKLPMLRSLGADQVIDYKQEDFTHAGKRYDLIFDVASNLRFSDCQRVLTATGKYVVIGHDHYGARGRRTLGSLPQMFTLMARARFTNHLPDANVAMPNQKELMAVLRELLAAGQITPVIDRSYGLGETPQALRYLMEGRVRGKVVITP
jgi:NADPH:quinone reductase-like Zn-dependent oxidoreductase